MPKFTLHMFFLIRIKKEMKIKLLSSILMLKRQDNMNKLKYMQIDLSLINHVTII